MAKSRTFAFLSNPGVKHDVNGTETLFYRLSMDALFELEALTLPLSKAAAMLMSSPERQSGVTLEKFVSAAGENIDRSVHQATPCDLAEKVANQRAEAIGTIVKTVFGGECKMQIGIFLLDSLTPTKEKHRFEPEEIESFFSQMDLPTVIQLVIGAIKANAEAFGPLGKQVAEAARKALGNVLPNSELPVENLTGSSSKTQSSGASVEASPSSGS